jgi:hypothetical protein
MQTRWSHRRQREASPSHLHSAKPQCSTIQVFRGNRAKTRLVFISTHAQHADAYMQWLRVHSPCSPAVKFNNNAYWVRYQTMNRSDRTATETIPTCSLQMYRQVTPECITFHDEIRRQSGWHHNACRGMHQQTTTNQQWQCNQWMARRLTIAWHAIEIEYWTIIEILRTTKRVLSNRYCSKVCLVQFRLIEKQHLLFLECLQRSTINTI